VNPPLVNPGAAAASQRDLCGCSAMQALSLAPSAETNGGVLGFSTWNVAAGAALAMGTKLVAWSGGVCAGLREVRMMLVS
jgi:hypothetical protein